MDQAFGPQDGIRRRSGAPVGTRSGLLWITETPPTYGLNLHHSFKKRLPGGDQGTDSTDACGDGTSRSQGG